MSKWGFGFSFDMELEEPLDFFYVNYKNGDKVRYDKRPHGVWKPDGTCSECGVYSSLNKDATYFCPNCGADMRREGESN